MGYLGVSGIVASLGIYYLLCSVAAVSATTAITVANVLAVSWFLALTAGSHLGRVILARRALRAGTYDAGWVLKVNDDFCVISIKNKKIVNELRKLNTASPASPFVLRTR